MTGKATRAPGVHRGHRPRKADGAAAARLHPPGSPLHALFQGPRPVMAADLLLPRSPPWMPSREARGREALPIYHPASSSFVDSCYRCLCATVPHPSICTLVNRRRRRWHRRAAERRSKSFSTTRSLSSPSRRPWASCAGREEGDVRGKRALSMRKTRWRARLRFHL
jgi:hypothetical protein